MKQLKIRKIETSCDIACSEIPSLLDAYKIEWNAIDILNWRESFPYCPKVMFRIAHADDRIFLNFNVTENDVRAVCDTDNGRSWEDSCVEFFLQPEVTSPLYYNFEFTCAGFKLIGGGEYGTERNRALMQLLSLVKTWSSLGNKPFGQRYGETNWQLSAIIPVTALYHSDIKSFSRKTMRGNFYKCGDLTPTPHFVSWNKIKSPKPQFHLPEFFGEIKFE